MAPVAITAMFLGYRGKPLQGVVKQGLARSGILGVGFLAGFLFLNPVYWCNPLSTLAAVIAARKSLLSAQLETLRIAAPGLVLDSFPSRLLAIPYQLFFAPLAFWDVPTYQQATAASEHAYAAIPIHGLSSGTVFSSLWCGLILAGLGLAVRRSVQRVADSRVQILAVWFITVWVGHTIVVPILWQRYYLPFIPIGAALSALAIAALWNYALRIKNRQGQ
jgi:4-amino-4-deoxy-L-arabinose transferase-like glycosyltransferase